MNILFVDDETMILNSLKRGMRKLNYNFYYVTSGQSALELMKTTPMDVVFSDMKMPKMSGLELLKAIEKEYPDTIKVILSGYAQLPQLIATINQSTIFKYVAKPWDLYNELIPVLEECVEYATFKKNQKAIHKKLETANSAYQNIFKNYSSKVATKDQSLDIIKIFQQIYTQSLKDTILDSPSDEHELIKMVDGYKTFIDMFIESVQKKEIYFEPHRVLNELQVELKKWNHDIKLEYDSGDLPKRLFMGRGLHLKPILALMLDNLMRIKTVGTVNVVVQEQAIDEEHFIISYTLIATKRVFSQYREIPHILLLYKSILKIFGGDLDIHVKAERIILLIKVALVVDKKEEDSYENSDR